MEHKTWNVYVEFEGQPLYAEFFDDIGDMDESEVVQYVIDNIIIQVSEEEAS